LSDIGVRLKFRQAESFINILPGNFDRSLAVNLLQTATHNVAQEMRPFLQFDYRRDIRNIFLFYLLKIAERSEIHSSSIIIRHFTKFHTSAAAGQKTAGQIEKETSLEPNKFNNGNL